MNLFWFRETADPSLALGFACGRLGMTNHKILLPLPKMHGSFASLRMTMQNLSQYFLARGGIRLASTGSNSNFGSSASGAKTAFVVFIQFLSSRSGKSGL